MINKLLIVDTDSSEELFNTVTTLKSADVKIITFDLSCGFIDSHTQTNLFVENIMNNIKELSETETVNLTNIGFVYSKQDYTSNDSDGYINSNHIIRNIQENIDNLSSWDYLVSTTNQLYLVSLIRSLDFIDINHFLYSEHYSTIFNYINSNLRYKEDGLEVNYLGHNFEMDVVSDELHYSNNWLCSMLTTFYSGNIKTMMDKYFDLTVMSLEQAKRIELKVRVNIRFLFNDTEDESTKVIRNVILYDLHLESYLEDVRKSLLSNTAIITFSKKNSFEEIKNALVFLNNNEAVEITNVALFQNNTNLPIYNILTEEPSTIENVISEDPSLNTWTKLTDFVLFLEQEMNVNKFDLFMCKIYSDDNWKYVIETISSQLNYLEIRSSEDVTGHIIFEGDWILESPAADVNLIGLYFDNSITDVKVHLDGGYVFTTQADLEEAADSWNSGDTTTYGNISTWDTGNITDMNQLFQNMTSFNEDIGLWNTSNVTNMDQMFQNCREFNQDISTKTNQIDSAGNSYTAWDTINVLSMNNMFYYAHNFNTSINNWNVSNVTNMNRMFYYTLNGNGGYNQPLDNWNTSNVLNFSNMFAFTNFNQDVSSWNVSNCTTFGGMFKKISSFNQDITGWDVANSDDFTGMFQEASSFNQDLNSWNIKSTANLNAMFTNATSFSYILSSDSWVNHTGSQVSTFNGSQSYIVITLVLDSDGRISEDVLTTAINNWDIQRDTVIEQIGEMSTWDTTNITDMSKLFETMNTFDEDISSWNTSNVTDMSRMFYNCKLFNQDISTKTNQVDANGNTYTAWDTTNVVNMNNMFYLAESFNTSINNWNVSNVTNMTRMFYYNRTGNGGYDQPLNNWNTSNVITFDSMFGYSNFNQDISGWDVANSNNFNKMFMYNTSFNQDLNSWNIDESASLNYMFNNASSFDQVLDGYYWLNHTGSQNNIFTGSSGSFGTLPDLPTLTFYSTDISSGGSSEYGIINMTIVSSSDLTILETDISLTNGIISEYTKNSNTNYTFKLLSTSITETTSLNILENSIYNDSIGAEYNESSNTFEWTWSYTLAPPVIILSSTDISNGDSFPSTSVNMSLEITNDYLKNNSVISSISSFDVSLENGYIYDESRTSETENYVVTVSGKTSNHPYYNSGSSSGYYIDISNGSLTSESPALDFLAGNTYIFDQSDSTNTGHPLLFYEDASKTSLYTTGVTTTGTAGSSGSSVSIQIAEGAPSILYYQCENHEFMGNMANVRNIINFKLGSTSTTGFTTLIIPQNSVSRVFNDILTVKSNNASNYFTWMYDSADLTISSMIVNDANGNEIFVNENTGNNELWIQITFSESIYNFDKTYFNVSNCKITNISTDTTFTIFTIKVETFYITTASVEVKTDTLITTGRGLEKYVVGPTNTSFNWNYDDTKPEISMTSSQTSGLTNNSAFVDLSFVMTLATSDFDLSSISLTGDASLSNFISASDTEYSVRVIPNNAGVINVSVSTGTFTDSVYGNQNSNSVSFDWTYDNIPPTVTISSPSIVNGEASSDSYIELDFTMSKPVSDFVLTDDVDIINGTFGPLTKLTDTLYTTKIYPTQNDTITMFVTAGSITDSAGNTNINNSAEFDWLFSSDDLLAVLSSSDISNGDSFSSNAVNMLCTTSDDITEFVSSDIVVSNGTISNINSTTKTFTVTSNSANIETTIKIPSGAVKTSLNVFNLESNTFSWTYSPPNPVLLIETSHVEYGGNTNISPIDFTLTFDQASVVFDENSLDISNGTITSFSGSGTTYQVSVSPSVDEGVVKLSLPVGGALVVDNGNHINDVSYNFEWNYDSTAPSITIDSDLITQDASSTLTALTLNITSSKNIFGLLLSHFEVSNGVVSNLSDTSGTDFTLNIQPFDESIDCSININLKADSVVDSFGNYNTKSNDFGFSYIYFSRKQDSSTIESIFENDADIPEEEKLSASDIDLVISAAFTIPDTTSPFSTTSTEDETEETTTVVKPPKITIPSEVSIVNRKVFTKLIDQIFATTSESVTSLTIDKSSMAVSVAAEEELSEIEEVVMVKSNQTEPVDLSSFSEDTTGPSAAYIPLANAGDFVIVNIGGDEYTTVANGDDTFVLSSDVSGDLGTYSSNDIYTISERYKIIFGSETIVDGGGEQTTTDGSGEETTTDGSGVQTISTDASYIYIPCFLEGTKILTTKGYKNIELLHPKKDKLLDKDNKQLSFLDIQKYSQDNNGKQYPYKIPKGSALSKDYTCNNDLYLTYNHCVYLPHLNKYAPVSAMRFLNEDKTLTQKKFTYYHVFTENYFSDTLMANGIPCESHSKYTFAKLRSIDPTDGLLTKIIKKANMLPNCMRNRLSTKEIKQIIKKFKNKQNKKYSKR